MSAHSTFRDAIPEMERRLRASGFSVSDLCKLANINPTTWSRWKRPLNDGGFEPRSAKQREVIAAFEKLVSKPKEVA